MTSRIICLAIGLGITYLLPAQQREPVQVRYTTDIGQSSFYMYEKMADSLLRPFKEQIVAQVGLENYQDVVKGVVNFPCDISIFCNGRMSGLNSDTVNLRLANLSLCRVAEFKASQRLKSIIQLVDLPEGYTSKNLYLILPSNLIMPVIEKKEPVIAPKPVCRPVQIKDWSNMMLSPSNANHDYWFNFERMNGISRQMEIARQVGATESSAIYSQLARIGRINNYLPSELNAITAASHTPDLQQKIKDLKYYYLASYMHAIDKTDTVRYAIIKLPYEENKTFFSTKDWERDVYFFIDMKKIALIDRVAVSNNR
jgi:hypothetical protein